MKLRFRQRPMAQRRWQWGVWGALALAIGIAAATASGPVGIYHDDGIYIGSAIALAGGEGYVIPHLPAAPWQAKYPPLFSWLLTPIAVFTGGPGTTGLGDDTLAWFRLPVVLSVWGALALLPGLFRRWGMPPRAAVWGLAITGCSPLVFQHAFHVMSEGPFLLFTVAVLRLLPAAGEPATPARWVACAVCVVAAVLCRSVGIALLPACAWVGWTRRREWAAWMPFLAGGVAFGVWTGVAEAARAAETARELGPLYRYYLGYSAWIAGDLGALARVAWENALGIWAGFGTALCGARIQSVPGWQAAAFVAGAVAMTGWRWWPRAELPAMVYLGGSLALFVIWPFPVDRFLIPLTPFAVWGAWRAGSAAAAHWRLPSLALPLVGGVALLSCIVADVTHFPSSTRLPLQAGFESGPAYAQAAAWVRANTAPDDVIVTNDDPWLWLATGRRTLPPGEMNPLWRYTGPPPVAEHWESAWRLHFERFEPEVRRLGARWLLAGAKWDPRYSVIWGLGIARHPKRFRLVWPPAGAPRDPPLWVIELVR